MHRKLINAMRNSVRSKVTGNLRREKYWGRVFDKWRLAHQGANPNLRSAGVATQRGPATCPRHGIGNLKGLFGILDTDASQTL